MKVVKMLKLRRIASTLTSLEIPVVLCGGNFALIAGVNEKEALLLLSRVKELFFRFVQKKLGASYFFTGEGIPFYLSLETITEKPNSVMIFLGCGSISLHIKGKGKVFADPNNNPTTLSDDLVRIARASEQAQISIREGNFSLSNVYIPVFRFMRILKRIKKFLQEGK